MIPPPEVDVRSGLSAQDPAEVNEHSGPALGRPEQAVELREARPQPLAAQQTLPVQWAQLTVPEATNW